MRTELIKPKVKESTTASNGMLDMVIAFDTTGSMCSYIEAVKKHVIDLIPKLFAANPKLKISIVAFGDYCDMHSKRDFGDSS
jgi:Mg-chelatase subunit ChlD